MSCSIALRRSPKPGALTATDLKVPRILFTTSVARASPSTSSAMISSGLPRLHDLLEQREQVLDGGDLGVGDEDVGVLEDGLHALGVGDEVRRDVALVEAHALGELELEAEGVALLDGDDAFLADLVHGLGDELADLGVGGGDRRGGGDLLLGLDLLGLLQQLGGDGLDGLLDAALERHRVGAGRDVAQTLLTSAWARTVAVVVPSPATSSVFLATSLTSSAPIFSYGSSSSISLAMETPSLVIVGAPHFFSRTTLRPFGPRVTFTASARTFMPRSRPRRASSSKAMILAMLVVVPPRTGGWAAGQCPRRTDRAGAVLSRPARPSPPAGTVLVTLMTRVLTT